MTNAATSHLMELPAEAGPTVGVTQRPVAFEASEERGWQDEAEKGRAQATALGRRKAAQATVEKLLWDGEDPEELDLDDEEDADFAMNTGEDLAGMVGAPPETGARQFKVKNLIDRRRRGGPAYGRSHRTDKFVRPALR